MPKQWSHWPRLLAACAAAVLVASCGGERPGRETKTSGGATGKTIRIAIITNAVAPFWKPMEVGMRRASERLGCEASSLSGWLGGTLAHTIKGRAAQQQVLHPCR